MTTTHPLKEKLGNAWTQLRHVPRTASMVWQASKGWCVIWTAAIIIQGILPVATVVLTKYVVDQMITTIAHSGSWETLRPLLGYGGVMGGLFILMELVSGFSTWIRERQTAVIEDHISAHIHETAISVDLSFYETPQYYDNLHRARTEARYRPTKLIDTGGALLKSAITLVAMGVVLFKFSVWIPIILIVSTIPALYVVLRHALKLHAWRKENTEKERHAWYYDWEMTSKETAPELRLFDLGKFFKTRYQDIRKDLRTEKLRLSLNLSVSQGLAGLAALGAAGGCVAWMGWRTINGNLTLGELALFIAAFRQGQQMMRSLLTNMGDIYRNILFLGDLYEFIDQKSTISNWDSPLPFPQPIASSVKFRDVSFSYPESSKEILSNFNLTIPANKITAIVGANGAGKSTLIRLLCRLYEPNSGHILVDDTPIDKIDLEKLREGVTVLFQTPVQYSDTAKQNIAMGCRTSVTDGQVHTAAKAGGAHELISALPQQYDTLLGKWFNNGTELSVGEWQKIALSRAFLRDAPIVLLDEPTSAMDSWTESTWMNRLKTIVENRTTVVITHRFTTAMRADIIFVMHNGKIIQSGSHKELLTQQGPYAQSWNDQIKQHS